VHRILTPERTGVEVDASQIESVIVNLAVNARDTMGTGGDLWVASGLTHVDAAGAWELAPGGYAFVSVRDNGSGMDATTRDRIFDPFFTTKDLSRLSGDGEFGEVGFLEGDETARELEEREMVFIFL
jgi:signal transduction histidine kinase